MNAIQLEYYYGTIIGIIAILALTLVEKFQERNQARFNREYDYSHGFADGSHAGWSRGYDDGRKRLRTANGRYAKERKFKAPALH